MLCRTGIGTIDMFTEEDEEVSRGKNASDFGPRHPLGNST